MVEGNVCLGDRYRLGSALVEISQGRQPCWKLGHRFGDPRVPATVVATRRSGWYYRVLEEGRVAAGDALDLTDRPLPDWTVERVFALRSEERRVGKECVSTCRSRWSPYH